MKVAIITGISSGIGKAIAEELKDYKIYGGSSKELDVTKNESIKKKIKEIMDKEGRIDLLINNAGLAHFNKVEELTEEEWDEQFNVNVKGLWMLTKEVLPIMKKQDSGNIINIGSMAGQTGFPTGSAYCATKWAVNGFTESLKQELRNTHIKCSVIMPGSVDTPFFEKAGMKPNPERLLAPLDIAKAVNLLVNQSKTSDIDQIIIRPALK